MSTAKTYGLSSAGDQGFSCASIDTDWQEPSDESLFKSDTINRSARKGEPSTQCFNDDEIGVVLQTNGSMNIMPAGISYWVNKSESDSSGLASSWLTDSLKPDTSLVRPAHAIMDAYWQNSDVLKARGISLNIDATHANIFGAVGMLRVAQAKTFADGAAPKSQLKIPTAIATEANVRFYGCSLVPQSTLAASQATVTDDILAAAYQQVMQIASGCKIALMNYTYHPQYVDGFLTQACGGGGYFVEHHDFPHIHMPLSPDCGGYIIIGKPLATCAQECSEHDPDIDPDNGFTKTRFAFTAFQIPYGYALYTPSNTLHGDGTLVGNYGISVGSSSTPADTVLFRYYDEATEQYAMLLDLLDLSA